MNQSEITKKYNKKYWTTFTISALLWLGICIFLDLYVFITSWKNNDSAVANAVVDAIRATYSALLITLVVGLIIFIFIKEKLRNTIWMSNLVLSVTLFGATGMWIILSVWAFDEFILIPLKKYYREKTSINKEIDKRL